MNELDHKVNGAGYEMIRYADDFVVLCRTKEEADRALALVREWTKEWGLTLHPEKTRLVDMAQQGATIDFLGFTLKRHTRRNSDKARIVRLPRQKSLDRLRDGIRKETRRCNGRSLEEIIRRINRRIRGWGNYFRSAVRSKLEKEDGWIRMRLRSILRNRRKRKGRGRGSDHNRWPNAFFASRGLVTLTDMHDKLFGPKLRGEH